VTVQGNSIFNLTMGTLVVPHFLAGDINAYDHSTVQVVPGFVPDLGGLGNIYAHNSSMITVREGAPVQAGSFFASDSAYFVVDGSNENAGVHASDYSTIVVNGRARAHNVSTASGHSTIIWNGGNFQGLAITDSATVNLSGLSLGFPPPPFASVGGSGKLTIFGSGFNYGAGPISDSTGEITGTLANGAHLTLDFRRTGNGEIDIVTVPEPSSLTLVALGSLGLSVCAWLRRKANG
jgi:hypothetical protein